MPLFAFAIEQAIPISALHGQSWFDAFASARMPQAITQAQRDALVLMALAFRKSASKRFMVSGENSLHHYGCYWVIVNNDRIQFSKGLGILSFSMQMPSIPDRT